MTIVFICMLMIALAIEWLILHSYKNKDYISIKERLFNRDEHKGYKPVDKYDGHVASAVYCNICGAYSVLISNQYWNYDIAKTNIGFGALSFGITYVMPFVIINAAACGFRGRRLITASVAGILETAVLMAVFIAAWV